MTFIYIRNIEFLKWRLVHNVFLGVFSLRPVRRRINDTVSYLTLHNIY